MVANSLPPRHPLFPSPPPRRGWWTRITQPNGIALTCHAKLNLFLHVNARRDDGYHDLQSWVAFAEVGDQIRIRESKQFHMVVDGLFAHHLPPAGENLITKTVNLLAARHNQKPNVLIELTKNLPLGTGMGGGSSNAAATAHALQFLWGFDWQVGDDAWLAREVGADVPVCLYGQSAMVSGMGDVIVPATPIPADCYVVIAHPGAPVSTGQVFNTLSPPYTPPVEIDCHASDLFELVKCLQDTRNDLAHPAMGIEPKILEAYRALTRQTGCLLARMTGSGSACFGLYAEEEAARRAASAIRRAQPAWWVRATRLLPAAAVLKD